jgi:hypothetical protein
MGGKRIAQKFMVIALTMQQGWQVLPAGRFKPGLNPGLKRVGRNQ